MICGVHHTSRFMSQSVKSKLLQHAKLYSLNRGDIFLLVMSTIKFKTNLMSSEIQGITIS